MKRLPLVSSPMIAYRSVMGLRDMFVYFIVARVEGIEPPSTVLETDALPLSYTDKRL